MADDRDSYVYSWSWHHLPPRRMQLRRLKRDIAAVQLGYLFELSRRWVQTFDSTIGGNTILKRFLPYAARGMGTEGAGPEATQLWDEFTWALGVICGRYESESRLDALAWLGGALLLALDDALQLRALDGASLTELELYKFAVEGGDAIDLLRACAPLQSLEVYRYEGMLELAQVVVVQSALTHLLFEGDLSDPYLLAVEADLLGARGLSAQRDAARERVALLGGRDV